MKKYSTLCLSLSFFIGIASGKAQTAEEHYTKGIVEMNGHQYGEALNEFNQAIEMRPSYTEAYYFRGLTKFTTHDSSAGADFSKVIALQPDHYKAYSFRGVTKFRRQDYQGAIQDLDRAIEIKPDYAEGYFYRGDSKMEMKDFDGAIQDLDKAISLKPEYVGAIYLKGLTLFLRKDYKMAIDELSRVIAFKNADYSPGSYYFRGLAEILTGGKDDGCKDLKAAAEAGYKNAAAAIIKYCP